MCWTRNVEPDIDYDNYLAYMEEETEKYPQCCWCGEHITDQTEAVFYDDEWYCEECEYNLLEKLKVKVEPNE